MSVVKTMEKELLEGNPDSAFNGVDPIGILGSDEPKIEHHQELSINEAIKLRIKLEEEVECADYLFAHETPLDITAGVKLVLEAHRCECATKLKRLEDILGRITITI